MTYQLDVSDPQKEEGTIKYLVTLETDLPEYRSNSSVSVRRRFNEFCTLHETVRKTHALPPLPGKVMFVNEKVQTERLEAFRAIMKCIAKEPELQVSTVVAEFLGVKLEVATEDSMKSSPPMASSVPEVAPREPEPEPEAPCLPATWKDNPLEDLLATVNAPVVVPEPKTKPKPAEVSSPPKSKPAPAQPSPEKKAATTPNPAFKAFSFNMNSDDSFSMDGEGMREAIKRGNAQAAINILKKGAADPNYMDQQGMTLLHVAALFNASEIAFALMDAGANLDVKNSQGETPLDCAPVVLASKMRERMQ